MFAVFLLSVSIVALVQFALYYCRAILLGVAASSVSDQILAAAHVEDGRFSGREFQTLAGLHRLTPSLKGGNGGLGIVGAYYRVMDGLRGLAANRLPALAAWSERELAICSRYAAVQIERRMQMSMALAASARSF